MGAARQPQSVLGLLKRYSRNSLLLLNVPKENPRQSRHIHSVTVVVGLLVTVNLMTHTRLQNKSEPSEVTVTVTSPNSFQRHPGNLCVSLNHSNKTVGGITPSPVHTRTLFKGLC